MLKSDAEFGVAESHRSLGIKMLAQGKYFRSHQTEEHRKIHESDRENHVNRSGAANGHQHHSQNEDRERLNDVEKTKCPLRYPSHRSPICSLEITSNNAKRRAYRNREGGGDDGNEYVSARSCDEPGQDIDAVLVCPERMRAIWRHQTLQRISKRRRVGRNKRADSCYNQNKNKDDQNRPVETAEARPQSGDARVCRMPCYACRRMLPAPVVVNLARAQDALAETRGSIMNWRRSTIRYTIIVNTAATSTNPCTDA